MKLIREKRSVQITGLDGAEARDFSIKADGHAFRILSSTIYTNKIRAVIRELVCNAWDAQQSSKAQDKPIEVRIPTDMEPVFSVKDFGTGLSHDDAMRLFSTYFDSTKSKSNTAIGAFGIGSKSPFSYVDSFLVESRHKVKKRTYNCFLTEEGSPSIMLMNEQDFEAGDLAGITISMNVDRKDIRDFEKEGRIVLCEFSNPSITTNIAGFLSDYEDTKAVYASDFLEIRQKLNYHQSSVMVKMGNVLYPVPEDFFASEAVGIKLTIFNQDYSGLKSLLRYGRVYIVKLPIGAVEVAPSREQLSMTDSSKKSLAKFITRAFEDAARRLEAEYSDFKTFEEYTKQFDKPQGEHISDPFAVRTPNWRWNIKGGGKSCERGRYSQYGSTLVKHLLSKLEDIRGSRTMQDKLFQHAFPEYAKTDTMYRKHMRGIVHTPVIAAKHWPTDIKEIYDGCTRGELFQGFQHSIDFRGNSRLPVSDFVILIHDTGVPLNSKNRAYQYFLYKNYMVGRKVYSIQMRNQNPRAIRALINFVGAEAWARLEYYSKECAYTPTMEELVAVGYPKPAERTTSGKAKGSYYVYPVSVNHNTGSGLAFNQDKSVENPSEAVGSVKTVYYFSMDEFKDWEKTAPPSVWARVVGSLNSFKADTNCDLLGLCKSHIKIVEENEGGTYDNWKPYQSFVKDFMLYILSGISLPPEAFDELAVTGIVNFFEKRGSYRSRVIHSGVSYVTALPSDNLFRKYVTITSKWIKQADHTLFTFDYLLKRIEEYKDTFFITGVDFKTMYDKGIKEMRSEAKFIRAFVNRYPILKCSDLTITEHNAKIILDYIERTDSLDRATRNTLNNNLNQKL